MFRQYIADGGFCLFLFLVLNNIFHFTNLPFCYSVAQNFNIISLLFSFLVSSIQQILFLFFFLKPAFDIYVLEISNIFLILNVSLLFQFSLKIAHCLYFLPRVFSAFGSRLTFVSSTIFFI